MRSRWSNGLSRKQDPCIFKVGFTHNPVFRWCNGTYGYAHSVEKWSDMTVFYASPRAIQRRYAWKSLIEKYRSISAASSGNLIVYLFGILFARVFYHAIFAHIYIYIYLLVMVPPWPEPCQCHALLYGWGKPGCRNVRKGGDNVTTHLAGVFMCYVVFRSFQIQTCLAPWCFTESCMHACSHASPGKGAISGYQAFLLQNVRDWLVYRLDSTAASKESCAVLHATPVRVCCASVIICPHWDHMKTSLIYRIQKEQRHFPNCVGIPTDVPEWILTYVNIVPPRWGLIVPSGYSWGPRSGKGYRCEGSCEE